MIQEAFIPIALPASGKTTFGNRIDAGYNEILSLGPDDVREHLYPGYSEGKIPFEDMDIRYVFDTAYEWAMDILNNGYSLWWDAVNTNRKHRAEAVANCLRYTKRVIAVEFNVPFDIIVERNARIREGHRRPPIETLEMMRQQMIDNPVSMNEGFWEVWRFDWNGKIWVLKDHEYRGGGSSLLDSTIQIHDLDDLWLDPRDPRIDDDYFN